RVSCGAQTANLGGTDALEYSGRLGHKTRGAVLDLAAHSPGRTGGHRDRRKRVAALDGRGQSLAHLRRGYSCHNHRRAFRAGGRGNRQRQVTLSLWLKRVALIVALALL